MIDKTYRTKTGRTLTDRDIEKLADEVARTQYEPAALRKRGRPTLGDGPSELVDRKSTRLNSSHIQKSRMPSSA